MTRFCFLSLLGFTLLFSSNLTAQRYLSEVFTDVTVTQDIEYANNITVITGAPSLESLLMDVYEPTGDTETERPVVIVAHSGEYLPVPLNRMVYGEKTDSAIVHLCNSLAKRGFVAIAYTYRQGWNPTATTQELRTGTYINAQYRAVQDGFSLVRFLRMDAGSQGNTFGIDTTRIISGGFGTGGQISASMAFLDRHEELELTKYLDPSTFQSYIDTTLSSNVYGTQQRPLNIANNPSYSNEIHFAFNLGGYVGDSTWIEAGDIPMVSFGSVNDPFAPFDFGAAIVRTTGDFLINCSGSKGIQRMQQVHGNNDAFSSHNYTDSYTAQADLINNGLDGLYPFYRPTTEDSPWNYWDTTFWNIPHPNGGTFNENGFLTNPDMSEAKGQAYLDTVANYLSPRIVCALNLPGCPDAGLDDISQLEQFSIYPNPSAGMFTLRIENDYNSLRAIQITDFSGKLVYETTTDDFIVPLELMNSGVYIVTVSGDYRLSRRKIVVQ